MNALEPFFAPVGVEKFRAEYFERRPLHLSAQTTSQRCSTVRWEDVLDWVDVLPKWRETGLQMIMDSRPVAREHFVVLRESGGGPALGPDSSLVAAMMNLGASLVLDGVEDIDVGLRRICSALASAFAGKAGVNVYCSRSGIQAFGSHCDPHEVFVVQCEGIKDWRIYENRAEAPTSARMDRDQSVIDRSKGAIAQQITMRPGDLLYIPRGFYHDAVARTERSLHLTFGVQPLYGLAVLDLVKELAMDDPVFRQNLPSGEHDPDGLRRQLTELCKKLPELINSPGFLEDIVVRQRTLAARPRAVATQGEPGHTWQRTDRWASIEQPSQGSVISFGGDRRSLLYLADAANWLLAASVFSDEQLHARFSHHPVRELDDLLAWFAKTGLVRRLD
ncbi:JmjC domain-containing protein [Qipengyuania spongiae]|uniref:Cupin domain-containing protein n=1 Tax=Qipengyuania spongiae TaxID=2909673 RepID=A0ABY5T1M5_9SPHN|nr:cupin domain-containing protein [Qipengyuania spongiae]UVI38839.1 cupin domain-containing protein [Qipengyuania spongiae]